MTTTTVRTIIWPGQSGKTYKYWIYPLPPNLDAKPGNYVFAREVSPGKFAPLYVGETGDLSERFDAHHKAACFKRHGATHIHAHVTPGGRSVRLAEEADIKARWNPPCND